MKKPTKLELTPKQSQVLDLIRISFRERGCAPSRSELASAMNLGGASSVAVHLNALNRKGYLKVNHGKYRGLTLVNLGELPLIKAVGEIEHQEPLFDESRTIDRVPAYLSERWSERPDYFLVIPDPDTDGVKNRAGDLVAIKEARHAASGTVVVARVDGIVHCKRFTRIDRQFVELSPMTMNSDPEQQPVRIDLLEHDFQIDGIVVGTIATRPGPEPT